MEDMRGMYITVPTAVARDKDLTDGAKMMYGFIASLAQQAGYCFATNAFLAEVTNNAERSVRNYIKNLKDAGYIDVEILYTEKGEVRERQIRLLTNFKGEKIEPHKERKKAQEKPRKAYGSQKNVMLTDEQYANLKAMYPNIDAEIENMSLYCSAQGKSYKNYYSALLSWMRRRAAEDQGKKRGKWDGVDY